MFGQCKGISSVPISTSIPSWYFSYLKQLTERKAWLGGMVLYNPWVDTLPLGQSLVDIFTVNSANSFIPWQPGDNLLVGHSAIKSTQPQIVTCYYLNHWPTSQYIFRRENDRSSALHGDWPWHAALYKNGIHVCDATIIGEQWLMTTASCFQGLVVVEEWWGLAVKLWLEKITHYISIMWLNLFIFAKTGPFLNKFIFLTFSSNSFMVRTGQKTLINAVLRI